jgi:hypothetical protein
MPATGKRASYNKSGAMASPFRLPRTGRRTRGPSPGRRAAVARLPEFRGASFREADAEGAPPRSVDFVRLKPNKRL